MHPNPYESPLVEPGPKEVEPLDARTKLMSVLYGMLLTPLIALFLYVVFFAFLALLTGAIT
jgi:hypothetical protein